MSAPTWYDVLDVAREASGEEVRSAWREQVADLEPGDRRFDALNRAARVLLDPAARTAYDASLPAEEPDEPAGAEEPEGTDARAPRPIRAGGPPTWLLAGLALVAAGVLAAAGWTWSAAGASSTPDAARAAQVAAERAVVPVLSYDFEHLEDDRAAAQALMTGRYRKEYDKLFAVLEDNAPRTRTRVTADVISSGIVRGSDDRVQVLVFVDRPTTNRLSPEPVVYKDQVTLSMQLVDGEWLVDDLITSPVPG